MTFLYSSRHGSSRKVQILLKNAEADFMKIIKTWSEQWPGKWSLGTPSNIENITHSLKKEPFEYLNNIPKVKLKNSAHFATSDINFQSSSLQQQQKLSPGTCTKSTKSGPTRIPAFHLGCFVCQAIMSSSGSLQSLHTVQDSEWTLRRSCLV